MSVPALLATSPAPKPSTTTPAARVPVALIEGAPRVAFPVEITVRSQNQERAQLHLTVARRPGQPPLVVSTFPSHAPAAATVEAVEAVEEAEYPGELQLDPVPLELRCDGQTTCTTTATVVVESPGLPGTYQTSVRASASVLGRDNAWIEVSVGAARRQRSGPITTGRIGPGGALLLRATGAAGASPRVLLDIGSPLTGDPVPGPRLWAAPAAPTGQRTIYLGSEAVLAWPTSDDPDASSAEVRASVLDGGPDAKVEIVTATLVVDSGATGAWRELQPGTRLLGTRRDEDAEFYAPAGLIELGRCPPEATSPCTIDPGAEGRGEAMAIVPID